MINITRISDHVEYVGVNDRTTERFEALWPLPYGVSYNSYLVRGSREPGIGNPESGTENRESGTGKVALIDGVAIQELPALLKHLQEQGAGRMDYIVVNHMEPDHSGSLPELLRLFPESKIVGNQATMRMLGEFYDLKDSERLLVVKHGDKLDLGGGVELEFRITPMVHWPETMMTYLGIDKTIFSGDAYGTFGALNGGVTDREMDTRMFDREMTRYYSNIVGKYGRFVLSAMERTQDLEVERICPTHGPVWEERIAEVVAKYRTLGSYEPLEQGVLIAYGSMYGNTQESAEWLARGLAARGVRNISVRNVCKTELSDLIADAFTYPVIIAGSPLYSMTMFPPMRQFLTALQTRELKNRLFGSFGGHAWAPANEKLYNEYAEQSGWQLCGHVETGCGFTPEAAKKLDEMAGKISSFLKE